MNSTNRIDKVLEAMFLGFTNYNINDFIRKKFINI